MSLNINFALVCADKKPFIFESIEPPYNEARYRRIA